MSNQFDFAGFRKRFFLNVFTIGFCIIFFPFTTLASTTEFIEADSSAVTDSTTNLRGVEREERYAGDILRSALSGVLFVPREVISKVLYSTGRGAYFATDPRVVEKVEEFLYFYDKRLGWHPVLDLDSEFKPEYGAALFYRNSTIATVITGKYSSSRKWKGKAQATLFGSQDDFLWIGSLTGELSEDDDFVFYSIGADPQNDPRSHFIPNTDQESAIYFQRREKLQLILGIRADSPLEFFFTSFYQQRQVNSLSSGVDRFELVFDNQLPGGNPVKKWRSIYTEIAGRYDTRKYNRTMLKGVSIEGYIGYSGGVNTDNRFLRSGFDLAAYLPVLKRNRLIVPRLVFNMVENLNTTDPILFFDYPRHTSFRGVSSRKLLRQDNLSSVPSLEYRWPLTTNLTGFMFSDALVVSRTLNDIDIANAPWAVGFGIKLHTSHSDRGQLHVAYGSEGYKIALSFGSGGNKNHPSEWR